MNEYETTKLEKLAEAIGALTILNKIAEKYKTPSGDIFISASEYIKLCTPYHGEVK
jgi:hypothetical protein